jgi:ribosomal protein S18 acetylase RimI-like enzyme
VSASAPFVRILQPADLEALRAIRLEALRRHPAAYGSSFEEEAAASPADFARRMLLPPTTMFGLFLADRLVGTTGLLTQARLKTRHIGQVFFVYVAPAARGSGLARMLVSAAIDDARSRGLCVLHLTVTAGNDGARRLYQSLGFRGYGVEQRGLLVDGRFHDVEHMACDLDTDVIARSAATKQARSPTAPK